MSKQITPPNRVSDGTHTYVLVRAQEPDGPDGRGMPALYEREPKDEAFQYILPLDYLQGLVPVPKMIPLSR